jgi:AraC-like DNA-binding protein
MSARRCDFERYAEVTPPKYYSMDTLRAHFSQVSRRQLYRFTHAYFERTPQKWLDEKRIEHAREALLKFRCIKEASDFLGFKHPAHFTRVFKRIFGICPKAYVRRMELQATVQLTLNLETQPGFGTHR